MVIERMFCFIPYSNITNSDLHIWKFCNLSDENCCWTFLFFFDIWAKDLLFELYQWSVLCKCIKLHGIVWKLRPIYVSCATNGKLNTCSNPQWQQMLAKLEMSAIGSNIFRIERNVCQKFNLTANPKTTYFSRFLPRRLSTLLRWV